MINPIEYYDNNISGAISLTKAMKENNIKNLIFSSSATVYGEPISLPIDELHQTNPINPYGRTKLFVEKFFQDLANSDSTISITSLRYFNPAGAHESGLVGETAQSNSNNLIPSLLRAIKRQESFKIFGDDYKTPDGTCKRDFIHVMDLADAHLAALIFLETNRGWHIFNIGTGVAYSVLEIIRKFCEVNHIKIKLKIEKRREGDVAISFASPKKANKLLKWKSMKSLDDICTSAWKASNK
jgi:UDP-glucose 4-epimerase